MINTIALVSGKGGSGKTLIAAALARVISTHSTLNVVLLDTDLGTGGISYYLGFKTFRSTGRGFADLIIRNIRENYSNALDSDILEDAEELICSSEQVNFGFIPIGNHRAILKKTIDQDSVTKSVTSAFRSIVSGIESSYLHLNTIVIVDCRGGVDIDSLQICKEVKDIIVISETDATSLQACQHLVDVIGDNDLHYKLKGFILNKVFDNPSQLAMAGASLFRCPYLGSLPFDIDAVRKYVSGELPDPNGIFERQLSFVASQAFPEMIFDLRGQPQKNVDFSRISLRDPDEKAGSLFITLAASYFFIAFTVVNALHYISNKEFEYSDKLTLSIAYIGLFMAMFSSLPDFNRSLGRAVNIYFDFARSIFGRSARTGRK